MVSREIFRWPTRINSHSATCIDNIITNKDIAQENRHNIELRLPDHRALFTPTVTTNNLEDFIIYKRCFSQENVLGFEFASQY